MNNLYMNVYSFHNVFDIRVYYILDAVNAIGGVFETLSDNNKIYKYFHDHFLGEIILRVVDTLSIGMERKHYSEPVLEIIHICTILVFLFICFLLLFLLYLTSLFLFIWCIVCEINIFDIM